MGATGNGVMVVVVRDTERVYAWAGSWYARVVSHWREGGTDWWAVRVEEFTFHVSEYGLLDLARALANGWLIAEREVG